LPAKGTPVRLEVIVTVRDTVTAGLTVEATVKVTVPPEGTVEGGR
jgi:hypothetical protein